MKVVISNTSGVPIYDQIQEQLREAIVTGVLADGEMLPSIRQLASQLKVSVITTQRAYAELEAQGLAKAVPGKGYFVTLDQQRVVEDFRFKTEAAISEAIKFARLAGLSEEELIEVIQLLIKEEY